MLPGQVFAAPPGLHGIDTNTVLDWDHCTAAKARGFSFCLRYVSRGDREQANDLHEAEARTILNAGIALMPVQHVARAGWAPTQSLGTSYGRNASAHVREIGFPPGVSVWLDLEGVKSSSSHATVIDYCNAWIAEVESAVFVPGVYIAPEPFSQARRSSGIFGRSTFGDQAVGFRTSRIGVISCSSVRTLR